MMDRPAFALMPQSRPLLLHFRENLIEAGLLARTASAGAVNRIGWMNEGTSTSVPQDLPGKRILEGSSWVLTTERIKLLPSRG